MKHNSRTRRTLAGVALAAAVTAPQLVVAEPAAAIPGLVKIVATSAANAANTKTVTALCPAGRVAVGGGGRINNGVDVVGNVVRGQAHLDGLRPAPGGAGYTARGTEEPTTNFAGNWSVTAIAVCAFPPPGYQILTATSAVNGADGKAAVRACDSGRRVVGTGGWLNYTTGDVVLNDLVPSAGLTSVAARGLELVNSNLWSVTAYAICMVPPPGGLVRAQAASALNSGTPKFVSVPCGAQLVHGAGFAIVGGAGEVLPLHLDDSPPSTVRVSGYEWEGGVAGNWRLTGYAVCAA